MADARPARPGPSPREIAGARLAAMADLVPRGSRIADVGSDHGLLPALLLAEGRSAWCVATEVGPRETLERLVGSDPRLEVRVGDGLTVIDPDDAIDVVSIGGMGARRIVGILERGLGRLESVRRLVLQPQSEWPLLRRWLLGRGWGDLDERLVRERGRLYLVLAARPGRTVTRSPPGWSEADLLEAGPGLLARGDPLATCLWQRRVAHLEAAHSRTRHRRAATALARARRILDGFGCTAGSALRE